MSILGSMAKAKGPPSGHDQVREAIRVANLALPSLEYDAATDFMDEIAWSESRYGLHPDTYADKEGKPYHGGIWQVDETGFLATQDIMSHREKLPKKHAEIMANLGIDWMSLEWEDIRENPYLNAIAARLYLSNFEPPIPEDKKEREAYWKLYYNTGAGKGKVP